MKTFTIFKKTMALAIMLTFAVNAFADATWGGTHNVTMSSEINGIVTMNSTTYLNIAAGVTLTVNADIKGSSSTHLYKQGAGCLILKGNNTYGQTVIEGGQLFVGNNTTTGTLGQGKVTVMIGSWLDFRRSNDYTFTYDISGAGGVYKYGAGTLILGGNLTYTGTNPDFFSCGIVQGVLQMGNGATGGFLYPGAKGVDLQANGTLRFNKNCTFDKPIVGAGKVEIWGTVKFTYDMTYTGTTTIGTTGTGTIGGDLYLGDGGTTGRVASSSNVIINKGDLTINRSDNVSWATKISGPGRIYKMGTNKVTLIGVNDHTGPIHIAGGTLQIGNGTQGSITSSSVKIASASSILRFQPGANMVFAGNTSGSGKVQYSGDITTPKRLKVTGTWQHTGGTEIEAGCLHVGNNTPTGEVQGNVSVAAGHYFDFDRSNDYTYGGVISGAGSVGKWNTNKVILTGNNTFTGTLGINAGTIQIGDGTSGALSATTGALTVTTGTNTTLRFEPGANMVFPRVISGSCKVEFKGNSGNLYLTGNNTYTGTTTVESGILRIGNNTPTGDVKGDIINNGTVSFCRSDAGHIYSGVISGTGRVFVAFSGGQGVTFDKAHTYTGETQIHNGTLTLASGGSIEDSYGVAFFNNAGKFNIQGYSKKIKRLYTDNDTYTGALVQLGAGTLTVGTSNTSADGGGVYAGQITGVSGTLRKNGTATLTLTGSCQHGTGTTWGTWVDAGTLKIGNGGTTGEVASSIYLTSTTSGVIFCRSDAVSYAKNIGGPGWVRQLGTNTLTFSLGSALSYTGSTQINGGTLALTQNTNINESSEVNFGLMGTFKLDVSTACSPARVIKSLSGDNTATEIALGTRALTIGESGQANGGGLFTGKFTGTSTTASVTKKGSGTLTLSGAHTVTGNFNHTEGSVSFAGEWKGKYVKSTEGNLDIVGTVKFGSLDLYGGSVSMNLLAATPSLIEVTGNVSTPSGVTNLNLTAPEVIPPAYKILITATGGIANTTPFSATPSTCELGGNFPTQLRLTKNVLDNVPPTPGAGVNSTVTGATTADLSWAKATDNVTAQNMLRYYVYRSTSNNITTAANCIANGTLLNAGGSLDIASYNLTGLDPNTSYYFNVVVEDQAGQKTAYVAKQLTTDKATLDGIPTITGDLIITQTLTAVTTPGVTSIPVVTLGTLYYQWKRGGVDIPGATFDTYTLVAADYNETITVTVTAENCQGSVTSDPTTPIAKATQTAPAAPTMASKTDVSITLDVIAGCEYRVNGGAWQTSPIFTGLDPETEYSFEARKAETDTHYASPESPVAKFTTDETAIEKVVLPNLAIYPNPCVSTVVIEGADNYLLKITTTEGLVINTQEIISNQQTIQVSDLPKGVYLFCLVKDGKMTMKKVVKE